MSTPHTLLITSPRLTLTRSLLRERSARPWRRLDLCVVCYCSSSLLLNEKHDCSITCTHSPCHHHTYISCHFFKAAEFPPALQPECGYGSHIVTFTPFIILQLSISALLSQVPEACLCDQQFIYSYWVTADHSICKLSSRETFYLY